MKRIIIKPVITEKSMARAAKGWYTFAVAQATNKGQIAQAIEDMYKVDVVDVRSMIMHGKERRAGKRMVRIRKSHWKKALVQLKAGQKLDIYESKESKTSV